MKVVHIESGLGNQMLSFCEYLALKRACPDEAIYIETITYDIPECNDVICQWNGYELERVFGIKAENIKDYFDTEHWNGIMDSVRSSEFWRHNWNWPVYIRQALSEAGLELVNVRGDFEAEGMPYKSVDVNRRKCFRDYFRDQIWYQFLQRHWNQYRESRIEKTFSNADVHFDSSRGDILTGQRLTFKNIHSGIELIDRDIRDAFVFPQITDADNLRCLEAVRNTDSVAIHVRRGDMTCLNFSLYRFGYFRKCVKYMKRNVDAPVFFFFCDSGSASWVENNISIFGLNPGTDDIRYVTWNHGSESYRDMQLMAQCKHQIITYSSFGWWGSWLNTYPGKITCSPSALINTTNHF